MSQENVERLRAALAAYTGKVPKRSSRCSILTLSGSQTEAIRDERLFGAVKVSGSRSRSCMKASTSSASRSRAWIDVGDQIVALGQMTARGRSTGVEAKLPLAVVFTAGHDGKLIRYESFRNRQEALAAAGLSE